MLSGGDLRSLGESAALIKTITRQTEFDALFAYLEAEDRLIALRAADVIEKISQAHPEFLYPHSNKIIALTALAENKEMKWHLAQLIPRLRLNKIRQKAVLKLLNEWACDKTNSRIVRVNALQAVYDLSSANKEWQSDLGLLIVKLKQENIPSLNARIRKIEKLLTKK